MFWKAEHRGVSSIRLRIGASELKNWMNLFVTFALLRQSRKDAWVIRINQSKICEILSALFLFTFESQKRASIFRGSFCQDLSASILRRYHIDLPIFSPFVSFAYKNLFTCAPSKGGQAFAKAFAYKKKDGAQALSLEPVLLKIRIILVGLS